MHELSLCEGILDSLQQQAQTQNYRRVTAVYLEIGALAGVEIESLRFGFDVVMKGTLADSAILHINYVAGTGWCQQCAQNVAMAQLYDECPQCGYFPLIVCGGQQMLIKQLEVE